jgi:hypothetical protein
MVDDFIDRHSDKTPIEAARIFAPYDPVKRQAILNQLNRRQALTRRSKINRAVITAFLTAIHRGEITIHGT